MGLDEAQMDRACGVLLGSASGDALGAGYEFGTARLHGEPRMIGGGLGNFAPGEWTDDTSMAYCVARVAATGADLRAEEALDQIAAGFADWYAAGPPDVGVQTSRVLRTVAKNPTAAAMRQAAAELHERTGRTAGNGSLMRTAPVALAYLDSASALVEAAMAVSSLTHADPVAGEACALWCLAIRGAVITGEIGDLRDHLELLAESSRDFWSARIAEAGSQDPSTFRPNGYVVTAFQAALSALLHTPIPQQDPARGSFDSDHFRAALSAAVAVGDDTDTVAAIAGGLLGARWGASAVPAEWRRVLHGWPGAVAQDLVRLAYLTARGGAAGTYGWPEVERIDYSWHAGHSTVVPHPHDHGVWLGGAGALDRIPQEVTAVVSLCLVGKEQVPDGLEHLPFRLLDVTDSAKNSHLHFVIDDAARSVAALRNDGHTVLLHCVAAQSRTPTVAIRYAHLLGVEAGCAYREVCEVLPDANPNSTFRAALAHLGKAQSI